MTTTDLDLPAPRVRPARLKRITARYDGFCADCWVPFRAGDTILWARGRGNTWHVDCVDAADEVHQTWKKKYGRCEDAPCCGCCGPQGDGAYYGDTENRW